MGTLRPSPGLDCVCERTRTRTLESASAQQVTQAAARHFANNIVAAGRSQCRQQARGSSCRMQLQLQHIMASGVDCNPRITRGGDQGKILAVPQLRSHNCHTRFKPWGEIAIAGGHNQQSTCGAAGTFGRRQRARVVLKHTRSDVGAYMR